MPDSFVETISVEIRSLLEPLVDAAESEDARRRLFTAVVTDLSEGDADQLTKPAVGDAFDAFVNAYESLSDSGGQPTSLAGVTQRLSTFGEVVVAIEDIESAFDGATFDGIAQAIVEYLVLDYLERRSPQALDIGLLLTVVEPEELDPSSIPDNQWGGTRAYGRSRHASLDLERVGHLLDAPAETLREFYLPETVETEDVRDIEGQLFPWVVILAGNLGFDLQYGVFTQQEENVADIQGVTLASRSLSTTRTFGDDAMVGLSIGLGLAGDELALLVDPAGSVSVPPVTVGDWQLSVELTADGTVALTKTGVDAEDAAAEVEGTVALDKRPPQSGEPAVRIGGSESTRLEIGTFGIEGSLTATTDGIDADIVAKADDSNVTVSGGDGDSFVAKVLPEDGLAVDFDAGLGWASGRGVYFRGGGGIDTDIPVQFSLGSALTVPNLHLAAKPDPSGETMSIPVEVSASPQVQLGPVAATVEQIGLEADVSFPEDGGGNLGPLDVELGFKPPSGAGLSVDASAVVGGGYLNFDPENERYSGTLQLQIGSLTLKAVGLLTTQLSDGRDGFSLLVIITGEFPPVQLGFGFTLNGLGGLLGVNRGTKVEALRSGLRDGTTKSVLFPKDPIRNASRIVSDLRRVFPPTRARHVFGPMAKLGWGTPTIMTAEIGVLVSLPSPVKLVILGRLHAALPDDEAALVVFNMDAIGVIDFGAKEASIDATLYDSRLVAYTLTGDMAMRTNWGEDPDFALSVGGFHPQFDPPEGFPELRRIALTLGPGNPRIRWSGYFAITSNTVQAGAKVELYAAAAGFSLSGHLGFDALFQFDPFKLIVDIAAGFAVKRGGTTLLSVQLSGSLKGPNPWHVSGKASFEIWPLSFSVNVDATFGEESDPEPLPPADVFGQVVDALEDERNWSAQLPEGGESIVTLRDVEREDGTVLAHPLGTLAVRQQVAPLGVTIETFGNARPETYTKYWVASVSVAGQSQSVDGEDAREQFAPAQFFEMSDAEKLEGPSFERYPAGTEVGNALFAHGGMDPEDADQTRSAELTYETSVVDERASPFPMVWKRLSMPQTTAAALTEVSAVARGPTRTTGTAKFADTDDASGPTGVDAGVSVSDTTYVVARTSDLRRVAVPDVPADGTTNREATEALDAFLADGDRDAGTYRVVASHEATGPAVEP
ncbi:DUF6603 domain-containing protein [Halosimplex salinum]|uniref:DUF6603 domain-containing protein n=1 Tax=Halosimplex salinum TaxID=1710538 RepID=UPI000F48A8BB|nr:DUF6603 domain-containing protein [Halosimplex salinum]